jgi:hypothetical protein
MYILSKAKEIGRRFFNKFSCTVAALKDTDELAKLPEMLADAQIARWQSKYGRESEGPTAIVASEQDTNGHSHY